MGGKRQQVDQKLEENSISKVTELRGQGPEATGRSKIEGKQYFQGNRIKENSDEAKLVE